MNIYRCIMVSILLALTCVANSQTKLSDKALDAILTTTGCSNCRNGVTKSPIEFNCKRTICRTPSGEQYRIRYASENYNLKIPQGVLHTSIPIAFNGQTYYFPVINDAAMERLSTLKNGASIRCYATYYRIVKNGRVDYIILIDKCLHVQYRSGKTMSD